MNRFFMLLVAIIFISTNIIAQTAIQPSGDGSSSTPYQISSVGNLYWISQNTSSWSKDFKQTADIDLSSYANWPVIGTDAINFKGNYDGNNYTIRNLTINEPSNANVGLFGYVGYPATIKNLGLTNVDIKGARGTGSLVGRVVGDNTTLIEYCYVDGGTVVGNGATGGLVGANNSHKTNAANSDGYKPKISKCYANVDVSWSKAGNGDKIGGLVGCNQKGITENSFAIGSVTVDNSANVTTVERVGGLAGCTYLRGHITNSFSASVITVTNVSTKVGGLVGYAVDGGSEEGTVTDSYWDIEKSGETTSGGGETGYTTSEMENSGNFDSWDESIWSFTSGQYPQLYQSDGATILPVELIAFEAKVLDKNLMVLWKTASEINCKHFEIQISDNGTDFKSISIIKGAGDSKSINTYNFLTDYNADIKYIRLKQVDFDGKYEYYGPLDIKKTTNTTDISIIVYPNPANSIINIELFENYFTQTYIYFYDINGKMVFSKEITEKKSILKIDFLNDGLYFGKIINKHYNSTFKILKN